MGFRMMSVGAIMALLGVALGAFGAHGLRAILSEHMLEVFHTGVRYQMYHAFGLMVSGGALAVYQLPLFRWAIWSFLTGIFVFSGSLYVLSLTGMRWLGAITPLGGLFFIVGWLLLAIGFWKLAKPKTLS
ncbi:MAG: membrane protein [Nitrospirales bacterium]|nr:MAG: membrane protein [Nitrospirales bacterium]